jgi:alpha-methylacyl-CoA racemase
VTGVVVGEGFSVLDRRLGGPLVGTRVVELVGIGPAPFCCMLLADLGADVIRVGRPVGIDNGLPPTGGELFVAGGRPSIAVDLKQPRGRALVEDLLRAADGVVEGFRPGVMERLGLGPDECLALNERLVYARVTGWGQGGPLAGSPGHDLNYIATSGALAAMGATVDGPPPIPLNLLGDYGGGGLLLALGVVAALLEVRSSGKGQVVDVAMAHGVALLMTAIYGLYGNGEWSLAPGSNLLDGGAPFYAVYRCSDGLDITIACLEMKFYQALLGILELDDAGIADQWDRSCWPLMRQLFAVAFVAHPRKHWEDRFAGTEVCFAPVLTMEEAPSFPQNQAIGVFVEADGMVRPAPAPRFSRTPAASTNSPMSEADSLPAALERWGLSARLRDEILASQDDDLNTVGLSRTGAKP